MKKAAITFVMMIVFAGTLMVSSASEPQSYEKVWDSGAIISNPAFDVAVGDTDGDGNPDIIVSDHPTSGGAKIYIFENTGDDSYQLVWNSGTTFTMPLCYMEIGDQDGDGKLEIIALESSGTTPYNGKIHVFENNGDNTYQEVWNSGVDLSGIEPTGLFLGEDADNDGKREIIIGTGSQCGDRKIRVYENTGDNTYQEVWNSGSALWDTVLEGAVGDTDGDGKKEIVVGSGDFYPRVHVFECKGDNYYELVSSLGTFNREIRAIIGDQDGDGKSEIIAGGENRVVHVFEHTGVTGENTYTSVWNSGTMDGFIDVIATGDQDNDGNGEMIVPCGDGKVYLFENSGDNTYQEVWNSGSVMSGHIYRVATGDQDGDGKLEIIATSLADKKVYVFENTQNIGGSELTLSPESWDFATVTEGSQPQQAFTITNDGTVDLVINDITPQSCSYISISDISLPATITPGGSPETFIATTDTTGLSGEISETITIYSNDPDEGTVAISVIGDIIDIDSITLSLDNSKIIKGEAVNIIGYITPKKKNVPIELFWTDADRYPNFYEDYIDTCFTNDDGEFSYSFTPSSGKYEIHAKCGSAHYTFAFLVVYAEQPIVTEYLPSKDGFNFENPPIFDFPDWVPDFISEGGYCFGMSCASLDYYKNSLLSLSGPGDDCNPPGQTLPPCTCLERWFIEYYQLSQFNLNHPTNVITIYMDLVNMDETTRIAHNTAHLTLLKQLLPNSPQPLLIPGHCVVAYKIKEYGDNVDIYIYDSNYPNDERQIPLTREVSGLYSMEYDNKRVFYVYDDFIVIDDILDIRIDCPVDIIVTDPEGLTIYKQSTEITGAIYTEIDINGDGDPDDIVLIPNRIMGDYQITVTPEDNADPTDTYTLKVSAGDTTIVLAEDVTISEIPDQPYIIRSTETTIVQTIPANINLEPETLNLKSNGEWITTYVELPEGYDVSNINVPTINLTNSSGDIITSVDLSAPATIGDYNGNGTSDLMVKFNRTVVVDYFSEIDIIEDGTGIDEEIELVIAGELTDGTIFEGIGSIRLIKRGK